MDNASAHILFPLNPQKLFRMKTVCGTYPACWDFAVLLLQNKKKKEQAICAHISANHDKDVQQSMMSKPYLGK